jgi:hypothetical protein
MGSGGFDRREAGSSTTAPAQRGSAGVPGKATRTSRLPPRPSSALPRPAVQARDAAAGPGSEAGAARADAAGSDADADARHAQAGPGEENAVMHVRAIGTGGVVLAEWRGAAFFYGDLPVRYVGEGTPLRWDDPAAQSIKIDSDAAGASGRTLAQWAPRGTRRIVVEIGARGGGAADGDIAAGSGGGAPAGARSAWDEAFEVMAGKPSSAPGVDAGGDTGETAGQESGRGQAGDGAGSAGSGAGSERARQGHARGSEAASWVPGGAAGVDGGRIGDPEHGQSWGRAGGEPGAEGHVDGPGIAGVLDVPEDIAPLVNTAALVADANLAGLGHKLLRQAVAGATERLLREQIEREARRMARADLPRVARRIDELGKYRRLPPAERKAVLDRAEAAMEGAYRKRLAQHARAQAEDHERVLAELDGAPDDQSAHLSRLARENAGGYRRIEAAASGRPRVEAPGPRPAAVAPAGEQDASALVYELNPKHTATRRGNVGAAPRDGQKALASSVRIKETSSRRVGIDAANREIVVFDEHVSGRFHGHVRTWTELTPAMQHALEQAGLVTRRGRIIED